MAISPNTQAMPATPQPGFTDPTTLPDEYAMRVRGDCLAPAINAGDAVLFDKRQPYKTGDLVGVYLKPGCGVAGKVWVSGEIAIEASYSGFDG